MHRLEKLRKEWGNASLLLLALGSSIKGCQAEAKELATKLEVAALEGDADECEELMEALEVKEKRYAELAAARDEDRAKAARIRKEIIAYYRQAADGLVTVDWMPTIILAEKANFTSWGGAKYNDGKIMLVDKALVGPDLDGIETVLRTCMGRSNVPYRAEIKSYEGRLRLSVMYPAYRGSCWEDLAGDRLLEMLHPIFANTALGVNVSDFCNQLQVLKGVK